MNFANPWLLILLILPFTLMVLGWKRGGQRIPLPFDNQSRRNHRSWVGRLINLVGIFPKLLMMIGILLWAGPRKYAQPEKERELTNIQFCIDVSGSMTANFGDKDRFGAAVDAMNSFIDLRKGDAFGLTFFGDAFLHWVPLTSDPSAFKCASQVIHPSRLPNEYGGTAIGKALNACEELLLGRNQGERMLLLISDGSSYDLGGESDERIIEKFKSAGIVLYTIHVGGGEIPESVDYISDATGGQAFTAGEPAGLQSVFARIDELKKTELKRKLPDPVDYFEPYVLLAGLVLVFYLLCQFRLRYTPW